MTMIVNLAGHAVSIFLFRFTLKKRAISFDLNEAIAEDMYPEINAEIQPLAQACCETLTRYRHLCKGDTIMDGNILDDGCFEVMLSKGLGAHFGEDEKQNLFSDARKISKLLENVMARRTQEMDRGQYPGPQPFVSEIKGSTHTSSGLEDLGKQKRQAQIENDEFYGRRPKTGTKQLKPSDLPKGVTSSESYDHRGRCIAFQHKNWGYVGRIVLVPINSGQISMEAEVSPGGNFEKKKKILDEIFTVFSTRLSST